MIVYISILKIYIYDFFVSINVSNINIEYIRCSAFYILIDKELKNNSSKI